MIIVKTWCENTREGCDYLKYNGYGKIIIRISKNLFACFGSNQPIKLTDVRTIFEKEAE